MYPAHQKWTLGRRLAWSAKAAHMLMWGLLITATGAARLLQQALPRSPWRGTVNGALFIAVLWELAAPWLAKLRKEDQPDPLGILDSQAKDAAKFIKQRLEGTAFVAVMCLGLAAAFSRHSWAALAAGFAVAALIHATAKLRKRSYSFAVMAWIVAGIAGALCRWPGDAGFALVFVIGGVATCVQGVVDIGLYYGESHDSPPLEEYAGKIG